MAIQRKRRRAKNLFFELIEGDIQTIHRSGRFRETISITSALRLIGISKRLLGPGVFIGGWKCCPLQLTKLSTFAPQVCVRFNNELSWTMFGLGEDVRVNGRTLPEVGWELEVGDEIQIESYQLRVVEKPTTSVRPEMIAEVGTVEDFDGATVNIDDLMSQVQNAPQNIEDDPLAETDFDLKLS
ncbi:hypothetical protein KOR42_43410 [Thalassoglobus neptunius]|uniref:FHA domain-containing protein n=1 Tax=Thalassoglobus neptunius TaxID=1938619 RepID=A0A5C5W6X7_9PLAN|nr:hypothetical protein [Thalassoglobus neptunius]TWT46364.1 hypothetical protein KOR42_43410 [Thalassoglobus neptunius]